MYKYIHIYIHALYIYIYTYTRQTLYHINVFCSTEKAPLVTTHCHTRWWDLPWALPANETLPPRRLVDCGPRRWSRCCAWLHPQKPHSLMGCRCVAGQLIAMPRGAVVSVARLVRDQGVKHGHSEPNNVCVWSQDAILYTNNEMEIYDMSRSMYSAHDNISAGGCGMNMNMFDLLLQ